jgi:putative ABC transport system substrate-binding protein
MFISSRLRRRVPWAIVLMVLAAFALPVRARGGAKSEIVVVTSREDGPYAGVLSGIRSTLSGHKGDPTLEFHSLQGDSTAATNALLSVRRSGRAPLLTIGSAATRAALEAPGDGPVIACMALDPSDLRSARNATGVMLEFPLETQMKWIQRFVPRSQSIGVLYNPAENRSRIEEAQRIARGLGMRLVAREVHRPQDLPDALSSLAREADLLWSVTDQIVLSPKTAEAILLFSFRNRMPFTGLSASWAKAGALYALDRDYEDLGAQCGEMAMRVLSGRRADSVPPATPRRVTYVINLRTAEHLKIDLPPEIVDGAAQVFR